MTKKMVSFDALGTLFRPGVAIGTHYAAIARQHGLILPQVNSPVEVDNAFVAAFVKQRKHFPNYGANQNMKSVEWWSTVVRETYAACGANELALAGPSFRGIFDHLWRDFESGAAYTLYPDTKQALQYLRDKGYILAVLSNSDERLVTALKGLGIDHFFDVILDSKSIKYEKPSKEAFAFVRSAVPSSYYALHVGDDIKRDYLGARNCGIKSLLLHRKKIASNVADIQGSHHEVPEEDIIHDLNAISDIIV